MLCWHVDHRILTGSYGFSKIFNKVSYEFFIVGYKICLEASVWNKESENAGTP